MTNAGRAKFYDTTDTQPISNVARFQVRSFQSGAGIKFDDGEPIAIDRVGEAVEGPWSRIQIVGVATLRLWSDMGGPLAGGADARAGISTPEIADVVSAPNGVFPAANAPSIAASVSRTSLGLQNQGTKPVLVALVAGANVAGGPGSKIVAVLSPCAAAYDGTGGSFSLQGYTGPVYLAGVGGASDVSVGAI